MNSIRASLDVQVAERVVNAIFTSRLDYCNSLLADLTVQDFTRIQRLHNAAARCVLMKPRDFSAKEMLCELHWLPVSKRVHYKLLLLTYKTLNGSAPEYLVNQLQEYCPTRALRSADQNLLSVKQIGDLLLYNGMIGSGDSFGRYLISVHYELVFLIDILLE